MQLNGSQIFVEVLCEQGVDTIFGYPGGSPNREFHNVNCRFCGAIHDVDWANISVLSQVIHSVNERKTVQTNMISFVSHGDKTL